MDINSVHQVSGGHTGADSEENCIMASDIRSTDNSNDVNGLRTESITTSLSSRSFDWGAIFSFSSKTRSRHKIHYNSQGETSQSQTFSHTLKVAPLFLSKAIEFVYSRNGTHSPSFSLQIRHIISPETFHRHVGPVLSTDNLLGFQDLIVKGICTINTRTVWGSPLIKVRLLQLFHDIFYDISCTVRIN